MVGFLCKALAQHVGIDDSRIQRYCSHAGWQFQGKRFRQSFDSPFGCTVRASLGIDATPPARTHVDDKPLPALDHAGDKVPQDIGRAFDVHINHAVKLLNRHHPNGRMVVNNRRIVDENIGRAEGCQCRIGPCLHGLIVGHIDRMKCVVRAKLQLQLGNLSSVASAADHLMASFTKAVGQGPAQSARYPGQDNPFHSFDQ